jgi:hypothetical protein
MHGESEERWMRLCEQAGDEQDPKKLLALLREINDILEERLKRKRENDASMPQP